MSTTPTVVSLVEKGLEFVRNEHGSIVTVRGPKSVLAIAGAEIDRRVQLFMERGFNDSSVPGRSGRCYCCGDLLPAPRTGGDCDLCTAARKKFYRVQEERKTKTLAALSKGAA